MKQGPFKNVYPSMNRCQAKVLTNWNLLSLLTGTFGQRPNKRSVQLDLPHSPYPGKHLGLPLFVGQNKRKVFGEIVEKIGKQISGWKAKTLSQVGSTVLIRSVIAALPIYTMSYFLLPKTRCLWRFGGALRKIRHNWMPKAWRDIYIPMEARGLVYNNCEPLTTHWSLNWGGNSTLNQTSFGYKHSKLNIWNPNSVGNLQLVQISLGFGKASWKLDLIYSVDCVCKWGEGWLLDFG